MADETPTRTRKPRGEGRPARNAGRQKPEGRVKPEGRAKPEGREKAEGRGKRAAGEGRAEVTASALLSLVARTSASFEQVLKMTEPALSLSQWAILEMLSKEDGATRPSQVGRKLGFSRQLIRLAAKKLLKLELIAAEVPEEGKKAVGLVLTDAGRAHLVAIEGVTDAVAGALNEDKRSGSLNQAARTLKVLSNAIATQIPKDEPKGRKKEKADADADADAAITDDE